MELPSHLQHLQDIPAEFLDPNASLVVMTEKTESALDDARLALDAVVWLCHTASSMNIHLRNAGANTKFLDVPPDSLAALLSLVQEKISTACSNPTLSAMKKVRPDLFRLSEGGV